MFPFQGALITCTAADSIALKNMTLYTNISGSFAANQTFGISGTQNSSSWNLTGLQDGLFIWSCLVYNTNSIPAWADSNRTFAVDRGPYWSSNISSFPSAYSPSQPSFFNITWNSSHGISAVYIEGNWSGQKNHTMQNANGTYRYNETLPAGSFYWKSYANTTNNAWNSTPSFYFSIAKAASPLRLFLNGSEGNISVNQNSSVNITAILSVTDSIAVYVNGTLRVNGSSPLTNITIFAEAGTFNVTAIYGGNENYTANSTTRYAVVNDTQLPVITSMDIFPPLTTVGGNMTVTAGITDNVNVTYAEYNTTAAQINGTLIRQGNVYNATVNTIGLAAGDYNVTVTARDGAGNSANSSVAFKVGGIRNITIRALDRNASSANVTGIRLVYNNRSEAYNQSQQNSSSFSSTLAAGVWDIAMLADFNFTVFSINVSDNITVNLTHDLI